jgi:hypothetical protein
VKCGHDDVRWVRQPKQAGLVVTFFRRVSVDHLICARCGYTEIYFPIEDLPHIPTENRVPPNWQSAQP